MKEGIGDDRGKVEDVCLVVLSYISGRREDVSEGKIKGLTVKLSLGSQRDRHAELKSDRQRKWEQKREMKRTTERERRGERGRAKESKRQKVIGSMMASSCMALGQTNSS